MTKHKPPRTVAAALARIQGQLDGGIAEMAAITSRSEGLVYAWSDPARREHIPVKDAILLDLAHRTAGGIGAPIQEFYALQLEMQAATLLADQQALGKTVPAIIKEVAEAEIAILHASEPGATPTDLREGVREVEEAIASLRAPLAILERQLNNITGGPETMPPT